MGISGVALAASQFVGGGQWNYGIGWTGNFGYSDYYHSTKKHSATTVWGSEVNRGVANPGRWAQSKIYRWPPTRMVYYYNYW